MKDLYVSTQISVITFHLQVCGGGDGSGGVGRSDLVHGGVALISGNDHQLEVASLELLGFNLCSIGLDLLSTAIPFHQRLGMAHHLVIGT